MSLANICYRHLKRENLSRFPTLVNCTFQIQGHPNRQQDEIAWVMKSSGWLDGERKEEKKEGRKQGWQIQKRRISLTSNVIWSRGAEECLRGHVYQMSNGSSKSCLINLKVNWWIINLPSDWWWCKWAVCHDGRTAFCLRLIINFTKTGVGI